MAPPITLLDLGLTLRQDHDLDRQAHIARLAARLGFRTIWLPQDVPPAWLAALREAARPADVGLVVADEAAVQRVAALDPDVLLEIHAPPESRDRLHAALAHRWRKVWLPWYDGDAGGMVVLADQAADRTELTAAARAASQAAARAASRAASRAAARAADGIAGGAGATSGAAGERRSGRGPALSVALSVALTVSIGRTRSEAEARALRDPELSGPRDPRRAGLFGTLEEAQHQALELARAGATALRATLADETDVADLLAHLRAASAAPPPVLRTP